MAQLIGIMTLIALSVLFFNFVGWLSYNGLIFIERLIFNEYFSPLVSWSIMGLCFGLIGALIYVAPYYGIENFVKIIIIVFLFIILGTVIKNSSKFLFTSFTVPVPTDTKVPVPTDIKVPVPTDIKVPVPTDIKETKKDFPNVDGGAFIVVTEGSADVYLNGNFIGKTNVKFTNIEAGTYKVYINVPNFYKSPEYEIKILKGEITTLEIEIPDSGEVAIISSEINSKIEINGKYYGSAPITVKLPVGKYIIREGDQEKSIEIKKNSVVTVIF